MGNVEEVRTVSSTGAEKGVKLERHDLIPYPALRQLAEHYGRGAKKYSEHNWRKGYEWSKSYSALQRHATAWWDGEDVDEETGSSHLAAVAFHAFALLTFIEEHPEFDDRFVPHVDDLIIPPEKLAQVEDYCVNDAVATNTLFMTPYPKGAAMLTTSSAKKAREKDRYFLAVQRPDGYPNSESVKEFIRAVNGLGYLVLVIPGTNELFLGHREAPFSNVEMYGEILPGDWVVIYPADARVLSDKDFSREFETFED